MKAIDYSRHTGTIFDARRLRKLSAVVVGAGALGNEVCRILGLLGAARVLIIDPDHVEPSNLTRSVLFRLDDFAGRNKAEALAIASAGVFPDTRWEYQPLPMADTGLVLCRGADIIFGCVDSDLARIEIAVAALRLNIPVVDGGLGADGDAVGRVSLYAGRHHACYVCQLLPSVRARLLSEHFQKRFSCSDSAAPSDAIPSTPALAAMLGAMQVDRAVRFLNLSEAERTSRSLELRLDGEPALLSLHISRDPLCPFHSAQGGPVVIDSDSARFIDVLRLARDPSPTIVLDWPVCTLARCRDCGHRWDPACRLGKLRARVCCPGCNSRECIALETAEEIDGESKLALRHIADFGFSANHIFFVNRSADSGLARSAADAFSNKSDGQIAKSAE